MIFLTKISLQSADRRSTSPTKHNWQILAARQKVLALLVVDQQWYKHSTSTDKQFLSSPNLCEW